MKVLLIDKNHDILKEKLLANSFEISEDYTSSKSEIEQKIHEFDERDEHYFYKSLLKIGVKHEHQR